MSEEMKNKEDAVFAQELNEKELNQVTGGGGSNCDNLSYGPDCTTANYRNIYNGGFPNCAATVESGSWCGTNDACAGFDIVYYNMVGCWFSDCLKAWK